MNQDTLPHDLKIEKALLGAILERGNYDLYEIDFLQASDFYDTNHELIFTTIKEIYEKSQKIDLNLLFHKLAKSEKLANINEDYIKELIALSTAFNLEEYASIIRNYASLRALIDASRQIIDQCYKPDNHASANSAEVLNFAEQSITSIATKGSVEKYFINAQELTSHSMQIILDLMNKKGGLTGIKTHFTELDKLTNGLQKGSLVVVAGRPGMGKTSFALNIVQQVATSIPKNNVVVFSLEMTQDEIFRRIISFSSEVSLSKINHGNFNQGEMQKMIQSSENIKHAGIYVSDSGSMNLNTIRSSLRKLNQTLRNNSNHHRSNKVDLVVIDYLGLMEPPTGIRYETKAIEIGATTRGLKALAKELDTPILLLSQLNRDSKLRSEKNKKPVITDLRDSGSIEQDADMILFLHREDYEQNEDLQTNKRILNNSKSDLIVAKNRNGPTKTIPLTFKGEFTKFENYIHNQNDSSLAND